MSSRIAVQFGNTKICGKTSRSLNGKMYYSFLGIPYAKPPVGDLRFLPPQAIQDYPKVLDGTEFKNCCTQYRSVSDQIIGSEDCLYLNVFIPKLPTSDASLPVAFIIHGGSHKSFSSNIVTPVLLIEYGFIVVTFNYRLHVLGFLNLGLPSCPGNVGLKDQLCALQWVKRNIIHFGGDTDNVTLLGMSSGASSAHMMIMSPLFDKMAKKIILCGGHALNAWNFNRSPLELAFKLGRKFGYEGCNKETLLDLLKSISPENLLEASKLIYNENLEMPCSNSFQPSVEFIEKGCFLPDSPENLWKKFDSSGFSVISGVNENEGVYFLRNAEFSRRICRNESLKVVISDLTGVQKDALEGMFAEIISFYQITENDDQDNFNAKLKLFTDLILNDYYVTFDFLHKPCDLYSVYSYKFAYCGENNKMRNMWASRLKWNVQGTYHVDEYGYAFLKENYHLPEKDRKVANAICTLWSDFIKNRDVNKQEIFGDLWKRSTKENPCYLVMDENLIMKNGYINRKRVQFWNYLSFKYFL